MNLSPPVTVVIPTHRRPDQMRAALESVLAQDYAGEIQVKVVFDAEEPYRPDVEVGPGRTLEIMTNQRSRGLAGGRNTGILTADHEYVAFLDDDDVWMPEKLSAQMGLFENEDVLLVGTAIVLDDGKRQYERLIPVEVVTHEALLRDRMAGLHSSSFVFRKSAFLGPLGLVDEDLPGSYGEDWDLLLRTSRLGEIAVANRPLVRVTWSQNSYFFGKWGAYGGGLQYISEAHEGFSQDPLAYAKISGQIAFARAANGERRAARHWARQSLSRDPKQIKAWLALAISLRLLSAQWVADTVQKMGKGI